MLTVLALEPWFGGSHARFLEQWRARSAHRIEVVGLPARHWKWRMHASPWELAQRLADSGRAPPDVLFVSDYVDLPALLGWLPPEWSTRPSLVYFHENQLTYPQSPGTPPAERDSRYGFTNVLTCVRADRVLFNSRYHLDDFAHAARKLLGALPRPAPTAELDAALERALVVSPGIELDALALGPGGPPDGPLRVVFNHRWEHDKDPVGFLEAVRDAWRQGAQLELVLLGQRFEESPPGTDALLAELAPCIAFADCVDRARYAELLAGCDVAVSTARHEFCGLAVLEALACGCTPLLPARLSYPELVPRERFPDAFYTSPEELVAALRRAAAQPAASRAHERRRTWRDLAAPHDAHVSARELDRLVDSVCRG